MLYTQNFIRNSFRMLWKTSRLCRRTWCTSKMTYPKSTASRISNIHADTWHMLYTQNFIRNSFRMLLWPSRLCRRTWWTSKMTCTKSTASRRSNIHADTWHMLYTQNFIRNSFRIFWETFRLCRRPFVLQWWHVPRAQWVVTYVLPTSIDQILIPKHGTCYISRITI